MSVLTVCHFCRQKRSDVKRRIRSDRFLCDNCEETSKFVPCSGCGQTGTIVDMVYLCHGSKYVTQCADCRAGSVV